jgi:hypothetical protein
MSSPGDGRGEISRAALDEVSTHPAALTIYALARVCTERLCTRSAQMRIQPQGIQPLSSRRGVRTDLDDVVARDNEIAPQIGTSVTRLPACPARYWDSVRTRAHHRLRSCRPRLDHGGIGVGFGKLAFRL